MSRLQDSKEPLPAAPGLDGNGAAGGSGDGRELDAASQSVSAALRTSFLALKIVLVLLILSYLGSGYFAVPPGSKAVVVRLGQIQGAGSQAGPVLEPGPHWMWPWPISQHIIEDTEKSRTLNVSFWFDVPPNLQGRKIEELVRFAPDGLNPGQDHYLLTGDQEIVHLRFAIKYKVDDLVAYVTRVNNNVIDERFRLTGEQVLLRTVAEWACTRVVAAMQTDAVVRGEVDTLKANIKRLMQARLNDEVGSALTVVDLVVDQREVPLQVRDAYLQVVQVENEKDKVVSAARTSATQMLNNAAGESHFALKEVFEAYDLARAAGRTADADKHMQEILRLIDSAGGLVANTVGVAAAERSRLQMGVRAEVRRFRDLYDKYKANPNIFVAQLWADARASILNSPDIEVVYLPFGGKEIRMTLDHNPQFLKAREARKYSEQVNQGR